MVINVTRNIKVMLLKVSREKGHCPIDRHDFYPEIH